MSNHTKPCRNHCRIDRMGYCGICGEMVDPPVKLEKDTVEESKEKVTHNEFL